MRRIGPRNPFSRAALTPGTAAPESAHRDDSRIGPGGTAGFAGMDRHTLRPGPCMGPGLGICDGIQIALAMVSASEVAFMMLAGAMQSPSM